MYKSRCISTDQCFCFIMFLRNIIKMKTINFFNLIITNLTFAKSFLHIIFVIPLKLSLALFPPLKRSGIIINHQNVYLATVAIIRRKSIFIFPNGIILCPIKCIIMEHFKNDFVRISSDCSSHVSLTSFYMLIKMFLS